jgi:RNA polymerase sigma-70 factor (ECF subfamily)
MNSSDDSFPELMDRLQQGDSEAARQVFERFAERLLEVARRRLHRRLRRKLDPEDVLQSVFRSFFGRQAGGGFALPSWDRLWGLLVVLTVRKCGRRAVHFRAGRRDLTREMSSASDFDLPSPEPSPQEVLQLTECVHQLLARFHGQQREMIVLRLQGSTVAEISTQLGRSERSVQRVLKRARDWLQRQ